MRSVYLTGRYWTTGRRHPLLFPERRKLCLRSKLVEEDRKQGLLLQSTLRHTFQASFHFPISSRNNPKWTAKFAKRNVNSDCLSNPACKDRVCYKQGGHPYVHLYRSRPFDKATKNMVLLVFANAKVQAVAFDAAEDCHLVSRCTPMIP